MGASLLSNNDGGNDLQQKLASMLDYSVSLSDYSEKAIEIFLNDRPIEQVGLAVYEEDKGVLTFPYSQQLHEVTGPQTYHDINSPLKVLLLQNTPMLLQRDEYLNYCQDQGAVKTAPGIWAACPIQQEGKTFAALILSADDEQQISAVTGLYESMDPFCQLLAPYLAAKIQFANVAGSEAKYRKLAESSMDITYQVTLKGYISYVSPNVKSVFGVDPSKLIGMHFKKFTPADQVLDITQALEDITSDKEVRNLPLTPVKPFGATSQLEVSIAPIYKKGRVIGGQGTVRDISEKHQAQQEIERLSFFPRTNPMPVVEIDREGKPSYINPAGIQLLDRMGLDMNQVAQILPPSFSEDLENALNNNDSIPSREVLLDGHYLLWSGFFLENQEILHYYGTDITSQKNTELELIEAQQIAVQNEQVKTLFLANMSHEIRTPLNSILGFLELIEEEVKQKYDEDLRSYFDIIRTSGKRLWHTVHEILDISQIETGTFPLKIVTVDLTRILSELRSTFASSAEEKHLELSVDIPQETIWVAADEYCTTQALSNLLDNAIKYTNEGHIKISVKHIENKVEVMISDTGIGMSREYQNQIFNAFSQESTGYTKHFQGVGLGLALAHRYLKLIRSDIKLTSQQDVGTTFIVTFPADHKAPAYPFDPAEAPLDEIETAKLPPAGDVKQILVVEDDPNSQKLVELILKKDYGLHFADSVIKAKKILDTQPINIILLDLSLKGNEDGLDLAYHVRNDSPYKHLPIIALTAHAFTTDRDKCLEAGCNEFLTKPYRRSDLIEMIQDLT